MSNTSASSTDTQPTLALRITPSPSGLLAERVATSYGRTRGSYTTSVNDCVTEILRVWDRRPESGGELPCGVGTISITLADTDGFHAVLKTHAESGVLTREHRGSEGLEEWLRQSIVEALVDAGHWALLCAPIERPTDLHLTISPGQGCHLASARFDGKEHTAGFDRGSSRRSRREGRDDLIDWVTQVVGAYDLEVQ